MYGGMICCGGVDVASIEAGSKHSVRSVKAGIMTIHTFVDTFMRKKI